MSRRIAVVGGGAAGMMAGIAAAENGAKVTLLEQNDKLGKKLFITGKGRCNVTNASEIESFFGQVIANPKFLYSAFYEFTNEQTITWFEQHGCPLKIERGCRVFPVSDHSSDIIRTLERALTKQGAEIRLRTGVKRILTENGVCAGVELINGKHLRADAVILATGGCSYPSTGSDGSGYRMAEHTGHSVTELLPGLVPLEAKEQDARLMQGLSLRNVRIQIKDGKKKLFEDFGEMLFTHFGVSGPLILSASSKIGYRLKEHPLTLSIDLKPALTKEQLDRRFLREFDANPNKHLGNVLSALYPAKLIPVIAARAGLPPDLKIHLLTRQQREKLVEHTKELTFTLTGLRGMNEAIITRGGIKVREVNPSTMESKLVRNLYFAGEMLDLDALTGGFNLQIAWSTGHLAGVHAAQGEESPAPQQAPLPT